MFTLSPTVAILATAMPAAQRHTSTPSRAGYGGGRAPGAPPGRSPNAAPMGAGAGSGGLSSGLWWDVFIVLLALVGLELRRNRGRPLLAGPLGVVSLLQRPG